MVYENKAMKAARILNAEDEIACSQAYQVDPSSQTARRNLIRAQFAFVDAALHGLRYMGASGDESKIPKKTRAKQGIEDAFNGLSDAIGLSLPPIDKKCLGWDAMTKAIRIRDRITHPKAPDDLEISDFDLEVIDQSAKWFSDTMSETTRAAGLI